MKPQHWVCYTALLARVFPALCSSKKPLINSGRQCHRTGSYCPELWLAAGYSTDRSAAGEGRAEKKPGLSTTMSQTGLDYSQHNVQCLKDLGSDCDNGRMDVIVAGKRHDAKEHVVFFGGDVQDYPENMQSHRDNGKYVRWNSLATAGRLCERFPTAMVLIVKPHHMHLKTFSVYSQFVQSNDFGCPTHTPDYGAWQRLVEVYTEAVGVVLGPAKGGSHGNSEAGNMGINSSTGTQSHAPVNSNAVAGSTSEKANNGSGNSASGTSLDAATASAGGSSAAQDISAERPVSADRLTEQSPVPVHLIGFSKGCIVLNQLLYELQGVENNAGVQSFISRVRTMTWLDGGHSGGSNTWVTDQAVLQKLAALRISVDVHVTPYQVKDEMRRWIGKEKRRFVELLQKAGAKVTDTLHFDDEPKSIENHFRVFEVF